MTGKIDRLGECEPKGGLRYEREMHHYQTSVLSSGSEAFIITVSLQIDTAGYFLSYNNTKLIN